MISESPTIRLHVEADIHESSANESPSPLLDLPEIHTLFELFPQVTGWEINRTASARSPKLLGPAGSAEGKSSSHLDANEPTAFKPDYELAITDMWSQWPDGKSCASRRQCDLLVQSFNGLMNQVHAAHRQIEILNAQMATAIPLSVPDNHGEILLSRLEEVMRQGLGALQMNASGLYLLDDATRELKLRVQVGLPADSLLKNPRRLRDSAADLDALVGNSVALSKGNMARTDKLHEQTWNLPEDFPAALCVPVATHSTPLGTLWFYSNRDRPITGDAISVAEIVGGRLASELERATATREGSASRKIVRDIDRARLWQQLQTPPPLPELDGWIAKGNHLLDQGIGGALFDFSISSCGQLVGSVGDIQGAIFESGLGSASMRGAMRTLEPRNLKTDEFLFEVNNALWNCPLGDQIGSLFQIRIDLQTGIAGWSNSGETGALIVGAGSEANVGEPGSPLGACPDESFGCRERVLLPDSTLFAFNDGFRRLFKFRFKKSNDLDILEQLRVESLLKPEEIHQWVDELWSDFDSYRATPDVSFIAIHRLADSCKADLSPS